MKTVKFYFDWITSDKTIKWCDLTGPEKHRLFKTWIYQSFNYQMERKHKHCGMTFKN